MNKIPPLKIGNLAAEVFPTGIEVRCKGSWLEPDEAAALTDWLAKVHEPKLLTMADCIRHQIESGGLPRDMTGG